MGSRTRGCASDLRIAPLPFLRKPPLGAARLGTAHARNVACTLPAQAEFVAYDGGEAERQWAAGGGSV